MFVIIYIETIKHDTESKMPFREKIAWIALLGILIAVGVYFGILWVHSRHPDHGYFVGLFLEIVILQVIISMIATIAVAITSAPDAGLPRDERDRLIERLAAGQAYYPLLVGVILAAVTVHFGISIFGMLNLLLAVIMLAEALRFGLQISAYRRGG